MSLGAVIQRLWGSRQIAPTWRIAEAISSTLLIPMADVQSASYLTHAARFSRFSWFSSYPTGPSFSFSSLTLLFSPGSSLTIRAVALYPFLPVTPALPSLPYSNFINPTRSPHLHLDV